MANATILYACTKGGLLVFNKPGTLPEWLPRVTLEGRDVLSAWAEPGPPIRVLASVSAAGAGLEGMGGELLLSENGGRDWQVRLDAPVTAILGLPGDPPSLYAGMVAGGMAGSVDGGETWGILPGFEEGGSVRALLADANEAGRIYALLDLGGETALLDGKLREGQWALETGGWRRQSIEGALALCQDAALGDLYAATADGVAISADKGDTWVPLFGAPAGGQAIVAIPGPGDAPPALLLGTDNGLYASQDGGGTWAAVALLQPELGEAQEPRVTALVRDPERRDRLYAATSTGYLFESGNRGQAWQPINAAPVPPVRYLFVIRF